MWAADSVRSSWMMPRRCSVARAWDASSSVLEPGQLLGCLEHAPTLGAETDLPLIVVAASPPTQTMSSIPLDVDPAGPAEHGALRGDVRRGKPVASQPLPDAGVEAAGHGVLDDADAGQNARTSTAHSDPSG